MRGAGNGPSTAELLPAFTAYNTGNYKLAAERFKPLAAGYPQSQLTLLYLGVSELFLQQNVDAAETLRKARATSTVFDRDAVTWYGAVAASRLRAADEAELLSELCAKKNSVYAARSCEALAAK
jgi:hypothetical protein